jgi:predicted anti-sigma-YlaC factor YlaD
MRYDCQDIRRLLESESDNGFCLDSFEEHLAGCRHCRRLVDLDQEMEEHLRICLPKTASPTVYENVMKAVTKETNSSSAARRLERLLPFAATAMLCVIGALVMLEWSEIRSFLLSIDLTFVDTVSLGLFSKLRLPTVNIGHLISYVGNETFIFAASFAAAALIWALSLLELEKTAK